MLAFIELVLKYDGADYVNWPGYARCRVHFALFNAMQKQGKIWEQEVAVDTDSEEGRLLLAEGKIDEGHLDELAQLLLSLEVQEALAQLTPLQRHILTLLFIHDLKPTAVAHRLGCTVRNINKHRAKALDRLRILLAY